ncbi:unnamed protein product [Cylicocyclus nassatus]|uniref:C2H2-type domain-containing protein n=1 Tax=Cylicocyclus nassatus TaxID=53992 RepID=A0AA36DMC4_CYLNA|nr:unnamed protein product [Cylicocyclus nassatus]
MSLDLIEDDYEAYEGESGEDDGTMVYSDRTDFMPHSALEQFRSRNRQYGNAVCPECKQSFVNAARLERHLAVHQVFGAYLCPLCGKTYKYEYNLFFHWRKTCQYLNELVKVEERKTMDVQSLRLLVEEVVAKRNELEPVDIGISSKALFPGSTSIQLEMPVDPQSPLARACMICGILVDRNHLPQHEALHSSSTDTGMRLLDMQSPTGGYYCDLCGVAFRRKDNLYAHWRSSCPEIMANIEPGSELFLSDTELKGMVLNLLMRLRRLSRQTPLRPIIANREDGEEVLPHHMEDVRTSQEGITAGADDGKGPSTSSNNDEKAVVFMDDYVNPADTVVDINGELVNVVVPDRNKWCISENGKPLECPDCFRQFANAGRLERHITGFHSHYGAHKCLLCGHRFKYDYNLLFHYRHSCAYTKLLVGADVRKLLDATSLRKLVSHIKQTDPDLRPGSSRLINIKRRPSIKPVPRNVLPLGKGAKAKFKRGLDEGKKCPVCDVVFFGQKSLDKHIGTVHLLSENFLDKAITRDHAPAVVHSPGIDVAQAQPVTSSLRDSSKASPRKNVTIQEPSFGAGDQSEDVEPPPILEPEGPGEEAPTPTRCVDVHGDEVTDFDAEQLSEMDMMLYSGHLALGDLVLTSTPGGEVEYRVAVGTRHGSQIVLEKISKASAAQKTSETQDERGAQQPEESNSKIKNDNHDKTIADERYAHDSAGQVNEEGETLVEEEEYASPENAEIIDYHSSQLVAYEVDDADNEQGTRRIVRMVDDNRQMVQYLNDEELPCEAYIQYVDDENGQQIMELIGEDGEHIVQYLDAEDMTEEEVLAYLKSEPSSASSLKEEKPVEAKKDEQNSNVPMRNPSSPNNMPEDFMEED